MRTVAALILLGLLARLNQRCGSSKWLPFEDETGFGYAEWNCERPRGHRGDHAGWLR